MEDRGNELQQSNIFWNAQTKEKKGGAQVAVSVDTNERTPGCCQLALEHRPFPSRCIIAPTKRNSTQTLHRFFCVSHTQQQNIRSANIQPSNQSLPFPISITCPLTLSSTNAKEFYPLFSPFLSSTDFSVFWLWNPTQAFWYHKCSSRRPCNCIVHSWTVDARKIIFSQSTFPLFIQVCTSHTAGI